MDSNMLSDSKEETVWIKEEDIEENLSDDSEGDSDVELLETLPELPNLPTRSRNKYISVYKNFLLWKESKQKDSFEEDVLMEYFVEMSEKFKPTSLWAQFSMIKSMMIRENKIDISTYKHLLAFLSRKNAGYQCKTTKTFTSDEINKFLMEAHDEIYLATKVAVVFGITGACKSDEFCQLKTTEVETYGNTILVKIAASQSKSRSVPRTFVVEGEYFKIVKKYEQLRPINTTTDRFFLNYQNGKCTHQVIGKNKFSGFARQVATYLKLPNVEGYTGNCFRRTAYALMEQAGQRPRRIRNHSGLLLSRSVENIVENPGVTKNSSTPPVVVPYAGSNGTLELQVPPMKKSRNSEAQDITNDPLATKAIASSVNIGHTGESYNITIPQKKVTFQFVNCSNITINFSN